MSRDGSPPASTGSRRDAGDHRDPSTGDDVWVADVDGVVVAEMILSHASQPSFLHHLYVDPSWMGRGLG
jgi:hypothetical protein